jgi:hypothetical protein
MRIAAFVFGGILLLFVVASFPLDYKVPGPILIACLIAGAGLIAFSAGLIDKLKVSKDGLEAQDVE